MNVSVGMTIYKVTWWYNIALSSHKQIRKKSRMQVLLDLGGDLRTALPNAGQFQDTEKISVYKKKKKVWISKITFLSWELRGGGLWANTSFLTYGTAPCGCWWWWWGGGGISMQCPWMGYLQGTAAGLNKIPLCWEINSQYDMDVWTG